MPGYTPLFSEIVTSSIWNEENAVRIIWITLMALADMDGNVYASVAGLAPVARVSIPECENAIGILSAPDQYSRSQEQQGRRIVPVDGGWHLVNHRKYRQRAKSRAAYMRQYREEKKKFHQKEKKENSNINANSVTHRNVTLQSVTVTKFTKNQCIDTGITIGILEQQSEEFHIHYAGQGWVFGNGQPIVDLRAAMVRWRNNQYKFEKKGSKSKLFPIKGKICSKPGCGMPAVYKDSSGTYDNYKCQEHMPDKVKEKYE